MTAMNTFHPSGSIAAEANDFLVAHPMLPRRTGTPTREILGLKRELKALSDVICTSGNAVKIVEAAPADRDLLFVPDENLGAWVMEQTGRPMTLWRGNCYARIELPKVTLEQARRPIERMLEISAK